jgi:hypothetical protein
MSATKPLHLTLGFLRYFCGIEEKPKEQGKNKTGDSADGIVNKRDPGNPVELRRFCRKYQDFISMRREHLLSRTQFGRDALSMERDFTPEIEAVWQHLRRIAEAAPYPPLENGPYTRARATAALDRIVNWCDHAATEPLAAQPASNTQRRMTVELANDKAMALAKADPSFPSRPLRRWADAIGCSPALVPKLPFWQDTMAQTGRGRNGKASAPKVVSLTDKVESVTGEGEPGFAVLDRLIANEDADRAKGNWEASYPNRPWEALSEEEQKREIAALVTSDEELERLVAQQRDDMRSDSCKRFRRRRRP